MVPRLAIFSLLLASASFGAVTRIEVRERTELLNGQQFGTAGAYERIVARAHFAVDPQLGPNRIIADIDLAPRNNEGKVEFTADLYILKPRNTAWGNGTALVEISNRGGKGLFNMFDLAQGARDPRTPPDVGDNFLLDQGFTLVWVGWEFDVPNEPYALRLDAPVKIGRAH